MSVVFRHLMTKTCLAHLRHGEDANSVERAKKQKTYAIGLLFSFNIFYKTEIFLVSISDGLLQTSRQLLTFSDLKTSLCDVSRKNLRQNGSGDNTKKRVKSCKTPRIS